MEMVAEEKVSIPFKCFIKHGQFLGLSSSSWVVKDNKTLKMNVSNLFFVILVQNKHFFLQFLKFLYDNEEKCAFLFAY